MNKLEIILLIEDALRSAFTERSVDFVIQRPFESGPILIRATAHDGRRNYYSVRVNDVDELMLKEAEAIEALKSDAKELEEEQRGRDQETVNDLNKNK